jgi:hypothetical protein
MKMSQKTKSFLALWNSVSPAIQTEYEVWHCFEHVPERTALPSFIQTRRYRSISQPLRYFTCYEVESLAAFESDAYKDVMANPTPWSARMRLALQDFLRMPCTLEGAIGLSSASQLVVVVFDGTSADAAEIQNLIHAHAEHTAVISAQWGRLADMSPYAVAGLGNQASNAQAIAEDKVRYVLMVQGIDAVQLLVHVQTLELSLQTVSKIVRPAEAFELLSHTRHDELPTLNEHGNKVRLPPRMDLFQRWASN